jgi:hypothetical protein
VVYWFKFYYFFNEFFIGGAVSFVLALTITGEYKDVIVTTTLFIIIFSIFFLGGLTYPLLKYLKIEEEVSSEIHSDSLPNFENFNFNQTFEYFDENYMKPFFINNDNVSIIQ